MCYVIVYLMKKNKQVKKLSSSDTRVSLQQKAVICGWCSDWCPGQVVVLVNWLCWLSGAQGWSQCRLCIPWGEVARVCLILLSKAEHSVCLESVKVQQVALSFPCVGKTVVNYRLRFTRWISDPQQKSCTHGQWIQWEFWELYSVITN